MTTASDSDDPGRGLPSHSVALAAVHRSARRRLILLRLTFVIALTLGTIVFGVGTGFTGDAPVARTVLGALFWGVLMGAFMWLFVRVPDRQFKAYMKVEVLREGHVTLAEEGHATISVDDARERTWRFGAPGEELSTGQGVWLAQVEGAPVALACKTHSHRSITVLWSRAHPLYGSPSGSSAEVSQ